MAFTAIGALVAGEAVTATLVLSAVAEVGLAMTVVGAVTGSEDLMKIGSVLGLVGGVGSLMAGAMSGAASAGMSELAGETLSKAALDGTTSFGANSAAGALDIAGEGLVSSAMQGTPSLAADLATPSLTSGVNPTDTRLASGTQSAPGSMQVGPNVQPTVNDLASPADQSIRTPMEGGNQISTPADVNPTDMRLANGTQGSSLAPQSSGNFWTAFSNFAEKNKTLFSSGLQLVGGAMKGANERDMWNQKMALDQQRVNQTSYGSQVANFAPGIIAGVRA